MFARLGNFAYNFRFAVIAVMVTGLLGLGAYGFDIALGKHLSQGGYFDDSAQSSQASKLLDKTFGRNHDGDIILLYTAPNGSSVDDPKFYGPIVDNLNNLSKKFPNEIAKVNKAYWQTSGGGEQISAMATEGKYAFASVALVGEDDTTLTTNYQKVAEAHAFDIPGTKVEVAGLQPVAGKLNATMGEDIHRMEILAVPAVAVLLFFIFGGIVAAALPLIVGGLTICGGWGIVRIITNFTEVNGFVSPVVSMVGLGLAIDYGLFIVSRFREEMAEGYTPAVAVRRTVVTAGRTVAMSVTIIVASVAGLLLFPQGFLKSLAYGAAAAVSVAGISALTVLPAMLGILGHRVDALGLKWIRKTKTADEVEASIWGRLTRGVMKHPLKVAIPIVVLLSLLIIPVKDLSFGGLSERLLPPNDPTRMAQEHFDELFPSLRADPLLLVIKLDNPNNTMAIGSIKADANQAPGLKPGETFQPEGVPKDGLWQFKANLKDVNKAKETIDYLRTAPIIEGVETMVTGTPALQQDSIDALIKMLPWMIALGLLVSTVLLFLTFGSLVLPIKAALMSALGLGSTLGVLTWVFVAGHGASLLNFTPGPIMAPVLVLIIALVYGLSVDYEVFLLSRMVEARAAGASTPEAVRVGMAHTSRIITAAALILIVVTGAFGFSRLVMMQYIAYGMIAALAIDATVLRMFLVPATMKLLDEDCWWAPGWLKKIQEKSGFAEPILAPEHLPSELPVVAEAKPKSNRPEDALTTVMSTIVTAERARIDRIEAFEEKLPHHQRSEQIRRSGPINRSEPIRRPDQPNRSEPIRRPSLPNRSEPIRRPDLPQRSEQIRRPDQHSEQIRRPDQHSEQIRRPDQQSDPIRRPDYQSEQIRRPDHRSEQIRRPDQLSEPIRRPDQGQHSEQINRFSDPVHRSESIRRPEVHRPPELNRMPENRPTPPPIPRPAPPNQPRPPMNPPRPPHAGPNQPPATPPRAPDRPDRRSIEDWLADLRSQPEGPGTQPWSIDNDDDEPTPPPAPPQNNRQPLPGRQPGNQRPPAPGRHHGDGDSVSVNDILRRGREDRGN